MKLSMLEYLASLRQYGHTPTYLGDVTIGRTVYAAGQFISPERPISPGCRAYQEGQRFTPAETRIALMPMYRTDHVTRDSVGPTPNLLPASYVRSSNVVYVDYQQVWFISGYSNSGRVLWLDQISDTVLEVSRRMPMTVHWRETFQCAMNLASADVLARINSQEQ